MMCEICSKLTTKTFNFGQISHIYFGVSFVDFEQVNAVWENCENSVNKHQDYDSDVIC